MSFRIAPPDPTVKWSQVIHIEENFPGVECGGELVVVVTTNKRELGVCCKKCLKVWLDVTEFPDGVWAIPALQYPKQTIINPGGKFKL